MQRKAPGAPAEGPAPSSHGCWSPVRLYSLPLGVLPGGGPIRRRAVYYFAQLLAPYLLSHRLLESTFYLHAQPPLFNLLTGTALKVAGSHVGLLLWALYLCICWRHPGSAHPNADAPMPADVDGDGGVHGVLLRATLRPVRKLVLLSAARAAGAAGRCVCAAPLGGATRALDDDRPVDARRPGLV